jgi:hypothetical protein
MPSDPVQLGETPSWLSRADTHFAARYAFPCVVLRDFFTPDLAQTLAQTLAASAWETVHALKGDHHDPPREGLSVDSEAWRQAPVSGRLFRFWRPTIGSLSRAESLPLLAVLKTLQGDAARRFFNDLCGIALGVASVEAHRMARGDFIGWHSDNRAERQLAFVIYLSRDEVSGGMLEFEPFSGPPVVIAPSFNTLVAFTVTGHRAHRVTPITRGVRVSLNGFFRAT